MLRMEKQLNELRALAAGAENRRTETGIPRVAMVQGKIPEHLLAAVYDPVINVILQGSKSMTVGNRTLRYDPATYFVMSIELPAVGSVHPSASGEPYLAVSLTLDPTVLSTLFADLPKPLSHAENNAGFSVAAVTSDLMNAWLHGCMVAHAAIDERPGRHRPSKWPCELSDGRARTSICKKQVATFRQKNIYQLALLNASVEEQPSVADHPRPARSLPFEGMRVCLGRLHRFGRPTAPAAFGMTLAVLVLRHGFRRMGTAFIGGDGASGITRHGRQTGRRQYHPHAGDFADRAIARQRTLGHWAQGREVATLGAIVFVHGHTQFSEKTLVGNANIVRSFW